MRMARLLLILPLTLIACGDNTGEQLPPDARPADAAIDAPSITCEYTEAMDADNDALFGTSNGEDTALMYAGSKKQTICGKFNSSHFDATNELVDVDSYVVHVTSATGTRVTVTAAGAENFGLMLVEIDGMTGYEVGTFVGTHAVSSIELMPGDYIVQVSAFDDAAATADLGYRLTLNPDNAATRCPKSTATPAYTEANDGATADGNDVYEVRYGANNTPHRAFTLLGTDNPEALTTTLAPNMSYHITGTLSNPTVAPVSWMDSFKERDTYAITTSATTNELALRVNWAGTTADLDALIFPMNGLVDFADAFDNATMEDEFVTFAVARRTGCSSVPMTAAPYRSITT
jgi:hypothetical protein